MGKGAFSKVLSVLVLLSLVITACGATPTATPVPPTATKPPAPTAAPAAPTATKAPAAPTAAPAAPTAAPAATKAPAAPTAAPAAAFNWKKYAGATISYMGIKNANHDFIISKLPEFEALTGIKVNGEVLPDAAFRQKLPVELQSGAGTVDAFATLPSYDALRFANAGWYEDLSKYLNNKDLTDPNLDYKDLWEACQNVLTVNGKLIGLGYQSDAQVLFYRKDLVQKYNVTLPFNDLASFEAAVKKIAEGEKANGIAGFVARGKAGNVVYPSAPYIFASGGAWQDASGKIQLNDPKVIAGLEFYGRLLRDYGPKGVEGFDVFGALDTMLQGKSAFWSDYAGNIATLLDPKQSKVVDTIGSTTLPGGKGTAGSWGTAIASSSKKKEAAWYFVQWVASKEMEIKMAQANLPTCRTSAWNDPGFLKNSPKEWQDAFQKSFATGVVNGLNPAVIPVPQVRDIIGTIVLAVIQKQDVKAAADKAQADALAVIAAAK